MLAAPIVYVERMPSGVRHELVELRRQTAGSSRTYEQIRIDEDSGPERGAKLTRLIREARAGARSGNHSANEVAALFASGSSGERITALGLMQGNHALASVDAITHSRPRLLAAHPELREHRLAGGR